jgi:acyl carrier protein
MRSETFEQVERAMRACNVPLPSEVRPEHSLVSELAFDSMAMVRLGVALEDELGRPILLDDWMQSCTDPADLTVRSLCEYLEGGAADDAVVPGH